MGRIQVRTRRGLEHSLAHKAPPRAVLTQRQQGTGPTRVSYVS